MHCQECGTDTDTVYEAKDAELARLTAQRDALLAACERIDTAVKASQYDDGTIGISELVAAVLIALPELRAAVAKARQGHE